MAAKALLILTRKYAAVVMTKNEFGELLIESPLTPTRRRRSTCTPQLKASRGTSVEGDGNALRLDARLLRYRNLEHAIGVARLDRVSLH